MNLLSPQERSDYERDGFIIVRNLFSEDEISLLGQTARADNAMDKSSSSMDDGEGNAVRLALWNHPGNGIYGMIARCRKLVERVEDLLDDEAYHYHSKMVLKDAKVGGAWAWHQDYGYWYQNGVLSPNLCSVMVAVDKATEENGCMQVLKGSHKLGRINHILSGDQAGADMERVEEAKRRQHAELRVERLHDRPLGLRRGGGDERAGAGGEREDRLHRCDLRAGGKRSASAVEAASAGVPSAVDAARGGIWGRSGAAAQMHRPRRPRRRAGAVKRPIWAHRRHATRRKSDIAMRDP